MQPDRFSQPAEQKASVQKRRINLFGATGSIGTSVLDVVRSHHDKFTIECLTASSKVEDLAKLAVEFGAKHAVIGDQNQYSVLKSLLSGYEIKVSAGEDALCDAARSPNDITVGAISGSAGIAPVLASLESQTVLALANKEALVGAGSLVMNQIRKSGSTVLPIDSEHNAIFQILSSERGKDFSNITITASGGPFRTCIVEAIRSASVDDALKHPNWSMGPKNTIDSATMMNKALELIEACHLFDLPQEKVSVLIHPQSIIHGMVHFVDGTTLAQLSKPDMKVPIAYCLGYPDRLDNICGSLDLSTVGTLEFELVDDKRFPAVKMARMAMDMGEGACLALNTANEVAVDMFLNGKIKFGDITVAVEHALTNCSEATSCKTIENVNQYTNLDNHLRQIIRAFLM